MKWLKYLLYGIIFLFSFMWMEAKRNRLEKTELYLSHLPESFHDRSIFFISDIHCRLIPKRFINIFKHETDLVIIGGDLLEQGVPLHRVQKNIRRLKMAGKVLFVWGNNDCEADRLGLLQIFEEEGVTVAENDVYHWELNGQSLKIGCLGDRNQRVDESSLHVNREIPILITHDPSVINQLTDPDKFEVALTGHTHGGQIRAGSLGIREKGGWKNRRGIRLFISNGYGTTRLPLRFGAPAEAHLFTLKQK